MDSDDTIRRVVADDLDWRELAALLAALGWADATAPDEDRLRRMIAGTPYVLAAGHRGRLVGYLRAFTDHVAVSWIAELGVHPDHQRRGVGSRLLQAALRDLGGTAVYGEALDGTAAFFARHGLKPRPGRLTPISRAPVRE